MSPDRRQEFYFDHNASTPVDPRVLERFIEVERGCSANPSSLHAPGRRARAAVEDATAEIAELFGLSTDGVLFVSGGTEANNMVVKGAGNLQLPVLLGPVEHPSVYDAAITRGRSLWRVDSHGRVVIGAPEEAVGLICLVHGQNEIGVIQPIESARGLADDLGVPLHVDAAQVLGRLPMEPTLSVADTVALSAHKVGGLRGMSVLLSCRSLPIDPLMHGGEQQAGRRPGTLSPSLAAATARALRLAIEETSDRADAMRNVRDAFIAGLPQRVVRVLTQEPALPNTAMIHFDVPDGRNLLPALDLAGVHASQGSACSAGAPQAPRILEAMALNVREAERCVRFSFAHTNTIDEAELGARMVGKVLRQMREFARPR